MKTKTQKVYIAEDGKEFVTEAECLAHETKIEEERKLTSYWQIINKPDLTEGRGHYGLIFAKVKVQSPYDSPKLALEDWCFRTFGRPIAFIQGCAPIENWYISKIDRRKWLEGGEIKVGDYSYKSKAVELKMGPREEGLIIESGVI